MKKIMFALTLLIASNVWANTEYCWISMGGKTIPDLGDSFNREFGFMGTVQAEAYCGSDSKPRYQSRAFFTAVFTPKSLEAKAIKEVKDKMAADGIVEAKIDLGKAGTMSLYTNKDNVAYVTSGSTCYALADSIACSPGSKVNVELGENNAEVTMMKNGYTRLSPQLGYYKK